MANISFYIWVLKIAVSLAIAPIPANLETPAGNKLFLHVYAKGVQIYRLVPDPSDTSRRSWSLVGPEAELYSDKNHRHLVGNHFAGPTWQSLDGSKVTGSKLQQSDPPDTKALPWLLLAVKASSGKGILEKTTFIQRLYTHGGKPPTTASRSAPKIQEVRVPYTAEYFFYMKTLTRQPGINRINDEQRSIWQF